MSMQQLIEQKLTRGLRPLHLEVVNESHMHQVPPGSESHFRVLVVSAGFEGQRLIARHRAVTGLLRAELEGGLHALALHTLTPEEWFAKGGEVRPTPDCLGGGKGPA